MSGRSRVSTLGRLIAATISPCDSRSSQESVPSTSSASTAAAWARTVGADSTGLSGTAATTTSGSWASAAWVSTSWSDAVRLAITATVWAWCRRSSAMATSAVERTSSGERSRPCTTSTTGAPRLAAIRALTVSSVPVEMSV